jgi:protein subunit release factor A
VIPPEDLEIEVIRDEPGGQHVGCSHAIKVTHVPSGIVAMVGNERSQHRNRMLAVEMIEAALTSPLFRG